MNMNQRGAALVELVLLSLIFALVAVSALLFNLRLAEVRSAQNLAITVAQVARPSCDTVEVDITDPSTVDPLTDCLSNMKKAVVPGVRNATGLDIEMKVSAYHIATGARCLPITASPSLGAQYLVPDSFHCSTVGNIPSDPTVDLKIIPASISRFYVVEVYVRSGAFTQWIGGKVLYERIIV